MLEHFPTNVSVNKRKLAKVFMASLLSLSIAACSSQSGPEADVSSNLTLSAFSYLQNAQKTSGEEKIDWQILASRALISQKQYQQAQEQLDNLKAQELTQVQLTQVQLAQTRLFYIQENIEEAKQELDKVSLVNIDVKQAAQYLELNAQLAEYESRYMYAAQQRLKRDAYIGEDEKQANWQKVWDDLSALPSDAYADTFDDSPVLGGWFELIQIHKNLSYRQARLQEAQRKWLLAHLSHPANLYPTKQMQGIETFSSKKPKRIALLLPLTGNAGELGNVVRDGFMSGMLDDGASFELFVHNTKSNTIDMVYQNIQQENADMIVGPLLKSSVQHLIAANDTRLPILALNIPQDMSVDINNTCFYSLSPEQEAEKAAEYMFNAGKTHPVIFSIKKSVNKRMANAFAAKWAELTEGQVVEVKEFSDVAELQTQIPQVFNKRAISRIETSLNAKTTRNRRLSKNQINKVIQTLPDVVYLLGQQSDLALMKPFIEVAANPALTKVEFYASSRSFEKPHGKKYSRETAELNGLIFSAMPIFVGTVSSPTPPKDQRLQKYDTQMSRLYAMGRDAYSITKDLIRLKSEDNYTLKGLTGQLSMGDQCIIQRKLTWARYSEDGIKVILPESEIKKQQADKQAATTTNLEANK